VGEGQTRSDGPLKIFLAAVWRVHGIGGGEEATTEEGEMLASCREVVAEG
jgi:hypothetical protein